MAPGTGHGDLGFQENWLRKERERKKKNELKIIRRKEIIKVITEINETVENNTKINQPQC